MIPDQKLKPFNSGEGGRPFVHPKNFSSYSTRQGTEKPSRQTYLDNKRTSSQKDARNQQKSVSERLEARHKTKKKVADLLARIGENELSDRMKLCSESFAALTCGKHLIQRIPNYSCNSRYCPFCAVKRSRQVRKKYLPKMQEFMRSGFRMTPVHLVLTQKHQAGETLIDSRKRLMASFKKLYRGSFFQSFFAGGLWAFETTIGTDGLWHAHLHILAFRRRFFDISILRTEWKRVSKGSENLRLDRITDLESGLAEVVKYISKPIDVQKFGPSHMRQFMRLKGARMCGAFGEFSRFCRVKQDEEPDAAEFTNYCQGDACPICEDPLFELRLTTAELIDFSRQIKKVALHSKYRHLEV